MQHGAIETLTTVHNDPRTAASSVSLASAALGALLWLAAPLLPATMPLQVAALLLPSAVTRPVPVITTRRELGFDAMDAINAAARRVPGAHSVMSGTRRY